MSPLRSLRLFCSFLLFVSLLIVVVSACGTGAWPGIGGIVFGGLVGLVGLAALIVTNSKGTK